MKKKITQEQAAEIIAAAVVELSTKYEDFIDTVAELVTFPRRSVFRITRNQVRDILILKAAQSNMDIWELAPTKRRDQFVILINNFEDGKVVNCESNKYLMLASKFNQKEKLPSSNGKIWDLLENNLKNSKIG